MTISPDWIQGFTWGLVVGVSAGLFKLKYMRRPVQVDRDDEIGPNVNNRSN